MRAVNLEALTAEIEENLKPAYEKCLSHRQEKLRLKRQELLQIKEITENLRRENGSDDCFEDWFYSFSIPHVSREFDLLKVGRGGSVVNVELKSISPNVTLKRVKRQLQQNRYYLSLIAHRIYSFTLVSDGEGHGVLYTLQGKNLKKCSFQMLINALAKIRQPVRDSIESMFKPDDFLISPFGEPERFCERRFFLTEHQQQIKARIINGIRFRNATLWGITGAAGTGKTLLIYDIAQVLSVKMNGENRVGVLHCGRLSPGHQRLKDLLQNVDIVEADGADATVIGCYDVICVDETQRLETALLEEILRLYHAGKLKACIFAYDVNQVLTMSEILNDNIGHLKRESGFSEQRLNKTIRTSREIHAFINTLFDLKKRSGLSLRNIDVLYAADELTAQRLLRSYRNKGYRYITQEEHRGNPAGEKGEVFANSQDVIGLEFDAVVVMIDRHYCYDESGKLVGETHPNQDYLYIQLLYQNVSRAKEKLCIVVRENPEVFRELIMTLYRSF